MCVLRRSPPDKLEQEAIGVIIVRSFNSYAKLYKDNGQIKYISTMCDENQKDREEAYDALRHDSAMGYDILMFKDGLKEYVSWHQDNACTSIH